MDHHSIDGISSVSSSSSDHAVSCPSVGSSPELIPTSSSYHGDQNTSPSPAHRRRAIKSPAPSTTGILRFSTPVRGSQSTAGSPSTEAGSSRDSSSANESSQGSVSPRGSFAPNYNSKSARSLAFNFPTHKRLPSSQSVSTFRKPYRSTKLKGEIEKPWIMYPDPGHRWAKAIFWGLFSCSFAVAAASEFVR